MTASEYIDLILQIKSESQYSKAVDDKSAFEAARLVSGSVVYPLYATLWQFFYDMKTITEHLERMYDSEDHFGFIYFIFMLADTVELVLPYPFHEMSANEKLVPVLSAAIIEDWLDYDASSEASEFEQHT